MENIILTDIHFDLDLEEISNQMRIKKGSSTEERLKKVVNEAQELTNIKAIYNVIPIEEKGENFIVVDGIKFTSQIMRVNLEDLNRVFPFVITCGNELNEWADNKTEMLENFWAETINEEATEVALKAVRKDIESRFNPGNLGEMNPGSLEDWPLEEQRPLFKLLGNVEEEIGVKLLDSCLMTPKKSVSGIFFASESGYSNCELCPMKNCPTRKVDYNENLYNEKYTDK